MGFVRQQAVNWRHEVPGARWFKTDLQVHSIDDSPNRSVTVPSDLDVAEPSSGQLAAYARRFLDAAVANGVQVLGLTPNCPHFGSSGGLSAAWHIVEEWNCGLHESGKPYREQIFAVFPGFKPRLSDGRGGLDLIFLFDPEIGCERYLSLFDLLMQGRHPWNGTQVATAPLSADESFDLMRDNRQQDLDAHDDAAWDYLVLAPDVFSETGLLGTPSEHVEREDFDTRDLTALELPRNALQKEAIQGKPWVNEFVSANRLAFFHSSAARSFEDIGSRHVWVKMASPTIEALRQAFIAHPTRLCPGHELDDAGSLRNLKKPPDVMQNERPWLRSVTVEGAASFFASENDALPVTFEFSPDLNCVIGGSMTGKSTLLDGLRVHVEAPLPQDSQTREQVTERAKERFLAGAASVELDCPGSDPTALPHDRWPAVFYTQGELKSLAQDPAAVQNILARLDARETLEIEHRESALRSHDEELSKAATRLADLDNELAEAEQALDRSLRAREELRAFSDAGIEELDGAASSAAAWRSVATAVDDIVGKTEDLISSMKSLALPGTDAVEDTTLEQLKDQWLMASESASAFFNSLAEAQHMASTGVQMRESRRDELRVQVERALADQGFDGARINEFQALNAQAALLDSYQANFDDLVAASDKLTSTFDRGLSSRNQLISEQRQAFDRVLHSIDERFGARFAARRIDNGGSEALEKFLTDLGQRGITRWWNDRKSSPETSPQELLQHLEDDNLEAVGMTRAVQHTFKSSMTSAKRRELAALRCPDRYRLEFMAADENYRPLDKLSGGQRVNLLLSLLLATTDPRPLVIDQPEDELDNRFLFETLLPALNGLKGQRQVIVATHNANIVVNGDADQVMQLEAEAEHGHVVCSGAIEDPIVRNAIVQTVDGGDEAFRLRRLKYGF